MKLAAALSSEKPLSALCSCGGGGGGGARQPRRQEEDRRAARDHALLLTC